MGINKLFLFINIINILLYITLFKEKYVLYILSKLVS